MANGKCRKCSIYCESSKTWGYLCLSCQKEYSRAWGKKRRAMGLPSGGKCSSAWWEKYRKEYYQRPEVKKRRAQLMRKYRNDPALRMRHEARWQVSRAIASGSLKKNSCNKCGEEKAQAHHHDYYKPLDVVWLCYSCHRKEHSKSHGVR